MVLPLGSLWFGKRVDEAVGFMSVLTPCAQWVRWSWTPGSRPLLHCRSGLGVVDEADAVEIALWTTVFLDVKGMSGSRVFDAVYLLLWVC